MHIRILLLFSVAILFSCCKEKTDYYSLSSLSNSNDVNAVIEISAGTNKKVEYNKETKVFEIDKKNGKERVIKFLPYLGNYGFIPSTYSDPNKGGDGDALDILVLSESAKIGDVIETVPIAILKLIDDGEIDYKIISVPSDRNNRIIDVDNFKDFNKNYAEVKLIIETWFLNYNKLDKAQIDGWGDEKEALDEINKVKKVSFNKNSE